MSSHFIIRETALIIIILSSVFGLAIPKSDDSNKNRVFNQPLSDEEHYMGEDHLHNPDFDHEAFLGIH